MGTLADRITVQFYEEEKYDMILVDILNGLTPKRNRAYKIKEILSEYFSKEMPQVYEIARQSVEGDIGIVSNTNNATILAEQQVKPHDEVIVQTPPQASERKLEHIEELANFKGTTKKISVGIIRQQKKIENYNIL